MQPLFNVNHYLMPTISPPLFKRIGLFRQILKTCDFWVPILLTRVPISTNLTNLGHKVPMAWLHCTSIWQWIQYKLVKRYLGRKKGCTTPGFVPRTKEIFLPLMCLLVQSIIILLVYGWNFSGRTKPEFDVIFIGCFRTLFRWLRVVLWQKLKQFLKIYEWQSVYIPLFGPLLHQWPV